MSTAATPFAAGERRPDAAPDREHALELLWQMRRIRRFEEVCAELYSATRIRGFLHLYIGEEAVAAGAVPVLGERDAVVGTYREHGHALARGIPMDRVMAEMLGRVDGVSRGRGGSMHLFDAATNFYGGNAIVGGGLPIAVGLGLAASMQRTGAVVACFFGEGAVDEGEFHESLNLSAIWSLPVVWCCENNGYSMGMALERAESQTNLALKAASYEMPAWTVDGNDVLAVERAMRAAVQAAWAGGGPQFLEFRTYRHRAHSMYDPDLYRPKEEIEDWKAHRDPVTRFEAWLREAGMMTDDDLARLDADIAAEVEAAVAFAEASGEEPLTELTRFVYSDDSSARERGVWRLQETGR